MTSANTHTHTHTHEHTNTHTHTHTALFDSFDVAACVQYSSSKVYNSRSPVVCSWHPIVGLNVTPHRSGVPPPFLRSQPTAVGGKQPAARWQHSAVATSQGRLIIFGGLSAESVRLNDCYVLHTEPNFRWEPLPVAKHAVPPQPRSHHSATLVKLRLGGSAEDEVEGMLVFGG